MEIKSRRVRKKQRKNRKIRFIRFIVVLIIFIAIIFFMMISAKKCIGYMMEKSNHFVAYTDSIDNNVDTSENKMEETHPIENQNEITAPENALYEEQDIQDPFTETKSNEPITSDIKRDDYKEIFNKDVFIGDSITNGLSFFGLLEEKRVLARLGDTLIKARNEVNSLTKLDPENIYILFGVNDIKDCYLDRDRFIERYEYLINKIKEESPNSNIYIQSILPVSAKVEGKKPYLSNEVIEEFNTALSKMSEKENIYYIDIASVLENREEDFHEMDGVHFKREFYYLWLNKLIEQVK